MDNRQEINSVIIRIKRKLNIMEIDQIESGSFRSHDTQELLGLIDILERKITQRFGEESDE
jgi:uncharacterized protein YfkK (UPF0435 family)